MRKISHWYLAEYLIRGNNRPVISLMFKVGSVAPDFMLRSMVRGHAYDTTVRRVERKVEKLEERGRWNLVSAYRLGYVNHYLADYFTAPHNSHGACGVKEHCDFEKRQVRLLFNNLSVRWKEPKLYEEHTDVMGYLRELHEEYMALCPAVGTDCHYIVAITEQVSYQMFAMFNKRQPEVRIHFLRRHAYM